MNPKELKWLFGDVVTAHGFEAQYGGWFRDAPECVLVLNLQRSNFGPYYQLNIRIFVRGLSDDDNVHARGMVKTLFPDAFRGEPKEYSAAMDMSESLETDQRRGLLEKLCQNFLLPLATEAATRRGLMALVARGEVVMLPTARARLEAKIEADAS